MNINKKIKELQSEGLRNNCYYLCNSKYMQDVLIKCNNDKEKLKFFYEICESWDRNSNAIPLEIGHYLEQLLEDTSITLGIHRSDIVIDKNDVFLQEIMSNGLENTASMNQGVMHNVPKLTKNISIVKDMFHTIPLLKGSYKGSNGSIIFAFPTYCLDEEGNILEEYLNQIYDIKNGIYYIKPEFIIGYLVAEYGVYNLYSKEDILKNTRK